MPASVSRDSRRAFETGELLARYGHGFLDLAARDLALGERRDALQRDIKAMVEALDGRFQLVLHGVPHAPQQARAQGVAKDGIELVHGASAARRACRSNAMSACAFTGFTR